MLKFNSEKMDQLVVLCRQHHVKSLHMFGSATRETFDNSRSDLDFIVSFEDYVDLADYASNYFSFHAALKGLFNRPVDLICIEELKNPVLLKEVEKHKVQLYAA